MAAWAAAIPAAAEVGKQAMRPDQTQTRQDKSDYLRYSAPFIVGGDGNLAPSAPGYTSFVPLIVLAAIAALVVLKR